MSGKYFIERSTNISAKESRILRKENLLIAVQNFVLAELFVQKVLFVNKFLFFNLREACSHLY